MADEERELRCSEEEEGPAPGLQAGAGRCPGLTGTALVLRAPASVGGHSEPWPPPRLPRPAPAFGRAPGPGSPSPPTLGHGHGHGHVGVISGAASFVVHIQFSRRKPEPARAPPERTPVPGTEFCSPREGRLVFLMGLLLKMEAVRRARERQERGLTSHHQRPFRLRFSGMGRRKAWRSFSTWGCNHFSDEEHDTTLYYYCYYH